MIQNQQSLLTQVPCTCGELFQGTLDGEPCLVSCPIDINSTGKPIVKGVSEPSTLNRKTAQALKWFAEHAGQSIDISIDNPLPAGRGYGTSTADIGAALFTASRMLNHHLTAIEAAQIAVKIEPTDSTFFPGLALFDHRNGQFTLRLGDAPSARLIMLDPGGVVDSEAYNAHDWRKPLAKISREHRQAFQLLQHGIAAGDLLEIGEASTLSAKVHQTILFNPLVDLAISLSKQLGAAGICRAHSGTIVGLIFPEEYDHRAVVEQILRSLPDAVQWKEASLVGGGPIYEGVG
jgi:L-threonine kinase